VGQISLIAVFCKDVPKMAFDLNGTIGPIIDGVVALMPSFLALVVGLIPVLITIAVAKFIVSFLGSIIDMLKL